MEFQNEYVLVAYLPMPEGRGLSEFLMSLLLKLITLPVTGPLAAAWWTANKLAEHAEEVYYDDEPIKAALMELELRLELGEIDEETFEAEETILLTHLTEIRKHKFQQT